MLRSILFIVLLVSCSIAFGQYQIPSYTVVKDSATHTTVLHNNDTEIVKVRNTFGEKGLFVAISPDIRIKNGIVDHRGLTGDMYVREYFSENKLIGYIQYDGPEREHEIYYNSKGDIYLEKRYHKGAQVYKNDSLRKPSALLIPIEINHGNTTE